MQLQRNPKGLTIASSIIENTLISSLILATTICAVVFNTQKFNKGQVFGIMLGLSLAFFAAGFLSTKLVIQYKKNKHTQEGRDRQESEYEDPEERKLTIKERATKGIKNLKPSLIETNQEANNALGERVAFVAPIVVSVLFTSAILTVFFLRQKGSIDFDVATNLMKGIGVMLGIALIATIVIDAMAIGAEKLEKTHDEDHDGDNVLIPEKSFINAVAVACTQGDGSSKHYLI